MRAPLLACLFFLALHPFVAAANTPDALAAIERNARNAHSDAVYTLKAGAGCCCRSRRQPVKTAST